MELLLKQLIAAIGYALFPPAVLFIFTHSTLPQTVNNVIVAPSPAATIIPSPASTPTPMSSPIPKPTNTPMSSPTPAPPPIPITTQQLDSWFTTYSAYYSIDRQKLWLIAVCESNLNPSALNGNYAGLYQFSEGTWRTTRVRMNLNPDPQLRFNAEEAIRTAAFRISTVGLSAWPNCGK